MTAADVMKMNACARGEITVARARDVSPEALDAARELACFVASNGRADLAISILAGLVALDDGDAWAWRSLAALQLDRGAMAAAGAAASQAARLAQAAGGTDPIAAWLLGRVLVAEGRAPEAVQWLASAAADPSAPRAVTTSATALSRRIAARLPRGA